MRLFHPIGRIDENASGIFSFSCFTDRLNLRSALYTGEISRVIRAKLAAADFAGAFVSGGAYDVA